MKKIILSLTVIFSVILFANTQTVNAQNNTVTVYTCPSMASYNTTNQVVIWYTYADGDTWAFPTITVQCNQQNFLPKQANKPGTLHMYVVNEISTGWYIIEGQQNITFNGDEQINVIFHWKKRYITPPVYPEIDKLPCSQP